MQKLVEMQLASSIHTHGFQVVKNFLSPSDVSQEFIDYLKTADKFVDGVITDIPETFMVGIRKKIATFIPGIAADLKIFISPFKFGYCAIRVNKSTSEPFLRKPFNLHQDPKIVSGGVLNWHLDHFSYYLLGDHANWLICYIPILKPQKELTNLAIIPTNIVKLHDPYLHKKIAGRGAMRFRCAEADTLEWFTARFPGQQIQVGDWFAIDDYDDSSMGFKLQMDLESHKLVPELEPFDLLIMRADVIHRTNDAESDRISVRCDAMPLNSANLGNWRGLILFTLQYPFMGAKRKYNLKKWLKREWLSRLKISAA
jgi:hypothetical protein